jgi:hypothetical protein
MYFIPICLEEHVHKKESIVIKKPVILIHHQHRILMSSAYFDNYTSSLAAIDKAYGQAQRSWRTSVRRV